MNNDNSYLLTTIPHSKAKTKIKSFIENQTYRIQEIVIFNDKCCICFQTLQLRSQCIELGSTYIKSY